ncbi:MAG: DUF3299 domain-containing protein [Planctomycetota bacterium]
MTTQPRSAPLLLMLLAAAVTLWWSYRDALAVQRELPVLEVRGTLIDDLLPGGDPGVPAPPAPPALERTADGVLKLDLRELAFPGYDPPELRDPKGKALPFSSLPDGVRRLQGERVAAAGYAMPLKAVDGTVTQFLLTRFPPGCCFGAMPVADEWIEVALAEPRTEPFTGYEKVTAQGLLDAGEQLDEQGYLLSLYRMTQASVVVTP